MFKTQRSAIARDEWLDPSSLPKVASDGVLKGHSFSCAAHALCFCHSERTLVREESAFVRISEAAIVQRRRDSPGNFSGTLLRRIHHHLRAPIRRQSSCIQFAK